MGKYLIDVPDDFNLKFEKGIDSQPGEINGKIFGFGYDYGAYSDTLIMSQNEYINKGWWKDRAIMVYVYSKNPSVNWVKTKVINYKPSTRQDSAFAGGCDFVANCSYEAFHFKLPIFILGEIKDHIVKIDSVQHYYRRLVYPRKGKKGLIGVYMRKRESDITTDTLYSAMVIDVKNLVGKQQDLALEILTTLRPKPKN